jgi:hypothetical protein
MAFSLRRSAAFWLLISITAGIFAAWGTIEAARAQTGGSVILFDLDRSKFPRIQAGLVVYDGSGNFVSGLPPSSVTILEGGNRRTVTELQQSRPGVQFVTVLTLGPSLAVRDSDGVSRYEHLLQGLQAWAENPPEDTLDDLSVLADGLPETVHAKQPSDWFAALQAVGTGNLRLAEPSLQMLGSAMAVAADPTPRPGMGRAILFITPPLTADAIPGLQSLAANARQQGTRVFVWLVSSEDQVDLLPGRALQQLASDTGGQFFNFTGSEAIPDLNVYLEPLRSVYSLTYSSGIAASGVYTLSAEVAFNDLSTLSPTLEFQLDLRPPNPVFVGLPLRVERNRVIQATASPEVPAVMTLEPISQTLEILIEFPDGYQRELANTALYINGAPAIVNTDPPFDTFSWDLSTYDENVTLILHVEATDILNMTGKSIEFPVEIIVERPNQLIPIEITPRMVLMVLLAAIVLGALVGLVLLLAGRIQPTLHKQTMGTPGQAPTRPSPNKTRPVSPTQVDTRPLTARRLPNWIGQRKKNEPTGKNQPAAYLTPLSEGEDQGAPIPLTSQETSFGRDSSQATWALDDPCLDDLHARLVVESGSYRLYDAGSIAGTWVNYGEVPPEGLVVEHGDMVHIGRIGFRFMLRDAKHLRKPIIVRGHG